ncbi:siderophore iron transporter mirB [Colletotrichum orchidophilum]|uniref:Siderophore iron transporter mirB n=1 Tax=Colletotrichum orchidophilum TaxID=1209926 RepID=A0A1G4AUQ6_9PEZI|nr:siderophore iron transporter mirB [Colletotrichum orchidophilum]OHE92813.1 siderophore iron transporter mirB [Colletotrichum orchidophilum]
MSPSFIQKAAAERQTQNLTEKTPVKTTTEISADNDTGEDNSTCSDVSVLTSTWVTSYIHSMQEQMNSNLGPYITSSLHRHVLTATTGIVSSLASGVSQLPLAKILNIFGRIEGYMSAHLLCCFGLIVMAVCRNMKTYTAAHVFWAIGSGSIGYIQTVLIYDITYIHNRMIIYMLNSTAYNANVFTGPIRARLSNNYSSF